MRPSLRSALWMSIAANLIGGAAVAFAQTPAPAPAAPAAVAAPAGSAAPAGAPTQAPPADPGKRSLIALRCKDDVAKLCPNVAAGGGRLAACLRSHEAEVSEACKAALPPGRPGAKGPAAPAAAGAPQAGAAPGATTPDAGVAAGHAHGSMAGKEWGPMKGMHRACAADVDKFCKDVPRGHGRIAVCLNEHTNDLSAACKPVAQDIATKMNEPMQMHADCAADVQKLCSDVPAGSGRTGYCLGEHTTELSPACKKHMDEMKSHWGKGGAGKMGMMGPGKTGMMHGGPAADGAPKPAPAPAPAAPTPAPAAH